MRDSSVTARAATLRADSIIDPAIAAGNNWEQQKDEGFDWKKILLVAGLGILSWISTYTGMLELIQANMGEVSIVYMTAIGFSVAMLMLMIIWLLDQLFGRLNFVVRLLFITGYILLTVISVGFGFGFYWKFLESRSESSRSAVSAVTQVQSSLNMAQTRLEQLQTTLDALTTISTQKAIDEREKGDSCPNSRPGDGPRRRLRDDDASRFEFAGNFVRTRVGAVKTDIKALDVDLLKVVNADDSTIDATTGTRNDFLRELSRKLDMTVTRFNAFRTDPQLRQFRADFGDRSEKTIFPDSKGGTFACPDNQLQTALRGVVLAIDQLPTLEKPKISAVEGSEAIIEAFRRLTTTMFGALQLKMPPTPDELRTQQQRAVQSVENIAAWRQAQDMQAGLGQRDYIPLLIAVFVDFCLLLVSVSRPMNRFQALIPKMRDAQEGPVIHILSRFHQIHQNPEIKQNFEVFRHVVFDYARDYYVAVPMRAPEHVEDRDELQTEAHLLANLFTSFEADKVFKRVSWPNSRIARNRLDRQGSKFSECESFRIYRFNEGAWSEMILGAIMGAAKRAEADERTKQVAARRLREELEPQVLAEITYDLREELEPQLREEVRTELEATMKRRDAEAKRKARKKRSFFDFGRPANEEGEFEAGRQGETRNGPSLDSSIGHNPAANDAAAPGAATATMASSRLSSEEQNHAADLARTLQDLVSELKEVRATTGRAAQAEREAAATHGAAAHAGASADVLTGRFGNGFAMASGASGPAAAGAARFADAGRMNEPAGFSNGHPAAAPRHPRQNPFNEAAPASEAPQVIDLASAKSEAEAAKSARFSSTDLDALSATLRRATQNSPHAGAKGASTKDTEANGEIRLNGHGHANGKATAPRHQRDITAGAPEATSTNAPRSSDAEVAAFVQATRRSNPNANQNPGQNPGQNPEPNRSAKPAQQQAPQQQSLASKLPPVERMPTILTMDGRREPTLPGPTTTGPTATGSGRPAPRPQAAAPKAAPAAAPVAIKATTPATRPAGPVPAASANLPVPAETFTPAEVPAAEVQAADLPQVEALQLGHMTDIDIESITARFGRKNRSGDPERKA